MTADELRRRLEAVGMVHVDHSRALHGSTISAAGTPEQWDALLAPASVAIPAEIRHAADELATMALVGHGNKTGRPDYVAVVALDKLLRWHEAMTALCCNLQQHRVALAALDTILFPADDHDHADKERMREQLTADLAEIMERRGWAGETEENIGFIQTAAKRIAALLAAATAAQAPAFQPDTVAVPVAVAQEWLDARWAWESKDRAVVASAYELNPEREGTMANYTSALKRLGQATTSLLNALAAALKGDGGGG